MAGAGLMTYQAKEVLNKVLNTSNDSLQVDIVDATGISITTTSDSVFVDDAEFTLGTSKGTMIMGFAGTQSVDADDAAALACDTDGALHIADGGNSITIDGTVTADLGATDNAVLDTIAASLAILDDWDDGNYANVNANIGGTDIVGGAGAVASGVQRVTLASDDPAVAKLGTIDADTGAIKTAVEIIDNAISGSEMQVDIVADGAGLATAAKQDILETTLTAIETDIAANEVLLGTIDADTGAIKTAVEVIDNAISGSEMQVDIVADGAGLATSANQLADGHNVTIDNSSGGAAVNIQDGGNTITVDGTVTADLSATDNAVLDAIATSLAVLDDWDDSDYANVNINIAGTDMAANAGAMSAQTPRVTIATDDTHFGSVGAGADVDGVVHGQLRFIGESVDGLETDIAAIKTAVQILDDWDDSDYANVNMNLAGSDAQAGEGTISASTQRVTIATDDDGVAHLATIAGDTTSIQTAVELIDDAIFVDDAEFTLGSSKGVMMMGFAGTQSVNANDAAALACGTDGSLLTTHSVTGIVDGVKTVTTAGTDVALVAGSTACKKVDIQAQTDNTGVIAVGATGVDATVATGTGIILNAGDVYSMEIDDLVNIYIDSAVNGEGVRFTYFT